MEAVFSMKRAFGTCTQCGAEDCNLTIINDVDWVCEECLELWYTQCDNCGEYWESSSVEWFVLKDDKMVCEYCAEDYDDDEFEFDD